MRIGVRFVMDKVAISRIFLRIFWFSSISYHTSSVLCSY